MTKKIERDWLGASFHAHEFEKAVIVAHYMIMVSSDTVECHEREAHRHLITMCKDAGYFAIDKDSDDEIPCYIVTVFGAPECTAAFASADAATGYLSGMDYPPNAKVYKHGGRGHDAEDVTREVAYLALDAWLDGQTSREEMPSVPEFIEDALTVTELEEALSDFFADDEAPYLNSEFL